MIATKTRDDAITPVQQDEANVLSAEANAKFYADQIVDTEIKSPVDGVIVSKALEVGEWVTPGVPILTVDDLSTIWARVDVEETDLGSLYIGKSAQVELPTNPPQISPVESWRLDRKGSSRPSATCDAGARIFAPSM